MPKEYNLSNSENPAEEKVIIIGVFIYFLSLYHNFIPIFIFANLEKLNHLAFRYVDR